MKIKDTNVLWSVNYIMNIFASSSSTWRKGLFFLLELASREVQSSCHTSVLDFALLRGKLTKSQHRFAHEVTVSAHSSHASNGLHLESLAMPVATRHPCLQINRVSLFCIGDQDKQTCLKFLHSGVSDVGRWKRALSFSNNNNKKKKENNILHHEHLVYKLKHMKEHVAFNYRRFIEIGNELLILGGIDLSISRKLGKLFFFFFFYFRVRINYCTINNIFFVLLQV